MHNTKEPDRLPAVVNASKEHVTSRSNPGRSINSRGNFGSSSPRDAQLPFDDPSRDLRPHAKSQILISTNVDTDADMVEPLRTAFVRALEDTQFFSVITETTTKKQPEYRLNLRFVKKSGSDGVIFAEFYDQKDGLAWYGDTECQQFRTTNFFNDASQALVSDILNSLSPSSVSLNGF